MGIKELFHFGRARDKPSDYYSGTDYRFLFGPTSSGKNVNEFTAMQTTAVYSCVRILSEAIASLPLNIYRYKAAGKERVYDHPLYHILHDEPNPEMTSFVFRETLMSHLLIWGNAYAQIIRDGAGRVVALYPLLPDKMQVCRDDKSIGIKCFIPCRLKFSPAKKKRAKNRFPYEFSSTALFFSACRFRGWCSKARRSPWSRLLTV